MKKKNIIPITVCMSLLIVASCSKEPVATSSNQDALAPISLHNIPFATQSQLDSWQKDADIVYYRTARMLAMIELGYSSHELSERPVVMYDFDNTPRYYEFIVTRTNGIPESTVCTYARKEQPAVVAFILPTLRDYPSINTKSSNVIASSTGSQALTIGYNTFAHHYPTHLYYGVVTRSGDTPPSLLKEDGTIINEIPPVQHLLDPLALIDDLGEDYFRALGIDDLPAQKADIAAALLAEQEAATLFWEQVTLIEDDLVAQEKAGWIATKGTTTRIDEFVLQQYDTEQMQKTYWTGGCGPSALTNMYRGLYDSYKGVYLPLWGDPDFLHVDAPGRMMIDNRAVYFYKDFDDDYGNRIPNIVDKTWIETRSAQSDNGLFADICDYGMYYFAYKIPFVPTWGAALPFNLTGALERVSNNEYTLSVLPYLFSHRHIRTQKLSMILLSADFSHYLHAFGSREQYWKWELVLNLFGKELRIGTPEIVTHRWFKINDSGTDMSKHDMLPFWMNDCLTNSIFHFAVLKKK